MVEHGVGKFPNNFALVGRIVVAVEIWQSIAIGFEQRPFNGLIGRQHHGRVKVPCYLKYSANFEFRAKCSVLAICFANSVETAERVVVLGQYTFQYVETTKPGAVKQFNYIARTTEIARVIARVVRVY